MTLDDARLRLDRALDDLTHTFRGMTARSDETQCTCHWGSDDELALLKTPGRELDPDLLRRTWDAPDWSDHGAVLRRILPQFARELVAGRIEPMFGMYEVGRSFARGHWQLGDELPWQTWDDEDTLRAELIAWLVRYAPDRLRSLDGTDELLHRVRLLGLAGPARWGSLGGPALSRPGLLRGQRVY
ncbi:hypothetical protein ACWD1Z_13080 [Streptomyces sp. NPDC002784]